MNERTTRSVALWIVPLSEFFSCECVPFCSTKPFVRCSCRQYFTDFQQTLHFYVKKFLCEDAGGQTSSPGPHRAVKKTPFRTHTHTCTHTQTHTHTHTHVKKKSEKLFLQLALQQGKESYPVLRNVGNNTRDMYRIITF